MIRVSVPPGAPRSYEIRRVSIHEALADLTAEDFVVTDANVWQHYASLVPAGAGVHVLTPGEGSKTLKGFESVIQAMLKSGVRRNGRVVALGGGVVGDLAGYVAASYMRGVDLVQIPTSLLAMVDSSVGGKVGIDVGAKNNVGAFHHPTEVRLATGFLSSLPVEEFRNGMAEVVKYALIMAPGLYTRLAAARIEPGDPALDEIVASCVELKQQVVEADPYERSGIRATLNFGHTFGHALEASSGYTIKHGYAVAIGMVLESQVAADLGMAAEELPIQVAGVLDCQGLPTRPSGPVDRAEICGLMRQDKKVAGNDLSFALVSEIGKCKLVHGISTEDVISAMERVWP